MSTPEEQAPTTHRLIVIGSILGTTALLLTVSIFLIPKYQEIFTAMKIPEMPLPTEFLLLSAPKIAATWWVILIGGVTLSVAVWRGVFDRGLKPIAITCLVISLLFGIATYSTMTALAKIQQVLNE